MRQIDVEYFDRMAANSVHCAYHCHLARTTGNYVLPTKRPTGIHRPAIRAFLVPSKNAVDNCAKLALCAFSTQWLNGPSCSPMFPVAFAVFSLFIKTNEKFIYLCIRFSLCFQCWARDFNKNDRKENNNEKCEEDPLSCTQLLSAGWLARSLLAWNTSFNEIHLLSVYKSTFLAAHFSSFIVYPMCRRSPSTIEKKREYKLLSWALRFLRLSKLDFR